MLEFIILLIGFTILLFTIAQSPLMGSETLFSVFLALIVVAIVLYGVTAVVIVVNNVG